MPGKVITVQRRAKLTWVERLYLPMILKGLYVTSRHFFRNLTGFITGNRTTFVVQYPEERIDYPDAFRGMPVLVQLENGQPKCVACGLCEFACPTDCITIVPGELEGAGIERYPEEFDIDMSRCMFCGLCEEACPEEAIVMSREVELSTYDRGSLHFHKPQLLVPEPLLKRRLEFIRADYDRPHAPIEGREGLMEDHGSEALRQLLAAMPQAVRETHARLGDATAMVDPTALVTVLRFLRDTPALAFDMLIDLTAVDYIAETPRFELVYHLFSLQHNHRVRIKARVAEQAAEVDSVVSIWPAANWMEREVWDMYGIRFRGHPDPRRILLYEEFEGHPLRKDYPKEKRQPLVGPRN